MTKTNRKEYLLPIEGECQLGRVPWPEQCCCVCEYLLTDYWHCWTIPQELEPKEGCGCKVIKGYICAVGGRTRSAHSGWPHHSKGCEMFTNVKPTVKKKDA